MLSSAVAIVGAIALLLPGFIVTEISLARGARTQSSDLELALRSLFYALVIQLVFAWWTAKLASEVGDPKAWDKHVAEIALYAAVVLVLTPVVVGSVLSLVISRVEQRDGPVPIWAAALGAGVARDAFDFAFQRVSRDGAWVIVELTGHSADNPRLVGGLLGRGSAVGQTPSQHDLFIEQLGLVDEDQNGLRTLVSLTDPPTGIYLPASQIARVEIHPPTD